MIRRAIDAGRHLLSQRLMRPLLVVFAAEALKGPLLRPPAGRWRVRRVLLQGAMKTLLAAVVAGCRRRNAFHLDAQPQPPHAQPACGIGQFSTAFALEWAMERAGKNGIAAATIRHSTHIGRLGEYSEKAAEKGFVTMITAGAAGLGVGGIAPWGGRERFLAPSPWAFGVPVAGGAPLVFDAAMSTVAQGKVKVANDKGRQLPPGCITDPQGNPSTNPPDFYAGGTLVPLGGQVAGHKGSGLALVAALLGGLGMIDDPEPTSIGAAIQDDSADSRGRISGVFLVAVSPSCFGDAERYQALVAETLSMMKSISPSSPESEILAPGEWERRNRELRARWDPAAGGDLPRAERNRRAVRAASTRRSYMIQFGSAPRKQTLPGFRFAPPMGYDPAPLRGSSSVSATHASGDFQPQTNLPTFNR